MASPGDAEETVAISQEDESTETASSHEKVIELSAQAQERYAVKKYEEAADLYAQATEMQAELNGEMAVENADLLFAYGRCLFHVAQKTSTVLGGTAASAQLKSSNQRPVKKRKTNGTAKLTASTTAGEGSSTLPTLTETAEPADVIPDTDVKQETSKNFTSDKPLFQITGDENFDDSSEEEDGDGEGEEGEEEEEDDFNTAYEVLDLARVLFLRKLETQEQSALEDADKGKYVASIDLTPAVQEVKTRIADIYDLQAEISLEGEKFDAAVNDLRSCLALKEELNSPDSSILAECHYKLSLALEAACQIQQRDADGNPVGEINIDWNLRNEAVSQQEKAIESCKSRVSHETKALEALPEGKDRDKAMAQVEDVQEMIEAMEQRLGELRKPPVSVKAEAEKDAANDLLGSVLGNVLGAGLDKAQQKEKLAEVMAGANDLSGMVKRKKPKTVATPETAGKANGNGTKRKIDSDEEKDLTDSKKARVEDVIE